MKIGFSNKFGFILETSVILYDKHALPHSFNVDDLVWYEDFAPLGKNPKLTPKWSGPAKITEINDTNARILLPNGKSKVLNVMHLKKFFSDKSEAQNDKIVPETLDFKAEPKISGPMTRAMKKLLDHKNAAQLTINVLCDLSKKHCAMCEWEQECSDNPLLFDPNFARQFIKERQSWLINKHSAASREEWRDRISITVGCTTVGGRALEQPWVQESV